MVSFHPPGRSRKSSPPPNDSSPPSSTYDTVQYRPNPTSRFNKESWRGILGISVLKERAVPPSLPHHTASQSTSIARAPSISIIADRVQQTGGAHGDSIRGSAVHQRPLIVVTDAPGAQFHGARWPWLIPATICSSPNPLLHPRPQKTRNETATRSPFSRPCRHATFSSNFLPGVAACLWGSRRGLVGVRGANSCYRQNGSLVQKIPCRFNILQPDIPRKERQFQLVQSSR